jgi:hypothetical protein
LGKAPDRVACCRDNSLRAKHTNNPKMRSPVTFAYTRDQYTPDFLSLAFQNPGICKVTEDLALNFLSGVSTASFDSLCMHSTTCPKNHPQNCNGGCCTGGVQTSIFEEKININVGPHGAPTKLSVVSRSKIHLTTAKDPDRLLHRSRQTLRRSAHYLTCSLSRMHCATGVPQGPSVRACSWPRHS